MKPDELKKRKKPELFAMAKKAGVKVTTRMTKAQIISALTLHYTSKKQTPAPSAPSRASAPAQKSASAAPSAAPSKPPVLAPSVAKPASTTPIGPAITPSAPAPISAQQDRIVLMVRDPYWAHAYWELSEQSVARARRYFGPRWSSARRILRVHDVTGIKDFAGTNAISSFDIEVNPDACNWYINVPEAEHSYCVEIGFLGSGSDFFLLTRSNIVQMPASGVSPVVAEGWKGREGEFEALYAAALGETTPQTGLGSLELRHLMERRLRQELASGLLGSLGSQQVPQRARGFRFLVDAELIVYGATEPNATVTVQGRPITLRPDGTFTLRFALPDGRQIIPVVANSADGVEERTIGLSVSRHTEARLPRILQQV